MNNPSNLIETLTLLEAQDTQLTQNYNDVQRAKQIVTHLLATALSPIQKGERFRITGIKNTAEARSLKLIREEANLFDIHGNELPTPANTIYHAESIEPVEPHGYEANIRKHFSYLIQARVVLKNSKLSKKLYHIPPEFKVQKMTGATKYGIPQPSNTNQNTHIVLSPSICIINPNESLLTFIKRVQFEAITATTKIEGTNRRAAIRLRYSRTALITLLSRLKKEQKAEEEKNNQPAQNPKPTKQ